MTVSDIDQASVARWLAERGRAPVRFEVMPGDVSARRYARIELADAGRAILASYPAEMRSVCRRFRATTELLREARISVPGILDSDCRRGLMLLEDAGELTLFDLRSRPLSERLPHFERALAIARRIATLPARAVEALNPPLDGGLLRAELRKTEETFLVPRGLSGEGRTRTAVEDALDTLCDALGRQRPVPCHRDFMSRNLVPQETGDPVVLDHQDLRLGPPAYDFASLLNDSFFPPADVEAELLADALADDRYRRAYHRAAIQRTLKAVGTFAAFAKRGSERHLPLIAPTLSRTLSHLAWVPETAALAPALEELWQPVVGGDAEPRR